jgi:hypothetical protein
MLSSLKTSEASLDLGSCLGLLDALFSQRIHFTPSLQPSEARLDLQGCCCSRLLIHISITRCLLICYCFLCYFTTPAFTSNSKVDVSCICMLLEQGNSLIVRELLYALLIDSKNRVSFAKPTSLSRTTFRDLPKIAK